MYLFIIKEINPLIYKTVDVSLILYAEHDFNASTFAARVTTSTLSDFYSSICSGIGHLFIFRSFKRKSSRWSK